MATRTCPSCGTQYVATVRSCLDCGELLVGDTTSVRAPEAKATTTSGDREQIGYELPGWGNQLKVSLEGMLDREGVPRVWEAAVLVVPAEFEAVVDGLIAAVEGDDLPEEEDDETDRVALEIEDLDQPTMDELTARLLAQGIDHAWTSDGDLVIDEADEARVIELVDVAFAAMEDRDGGDSDAPAVLSELFIAVDRLAKRQDVHRGADALRSAAERVEALGVPYGLEAAAWDDIVTGVRELVAVLDGDDVDEDGSEDDGGDSEDDGGDGGDDDGGDGVEDEVGGEVGRRARALREQLRWIA